MSIMFELFKSTGKKVCPPNYIRKSHCPLIVRSTSEDILTSSVFGILKNLDPTIWLTRFLGEAIKGRDFSNCSFANITFEFWKKYRPSINRKYREGTSEIDLGIFYDDTAVFIECKYLAPVNLKTTHDSRRDQVIRYLDLAAYHYLNTAKEFHFVLITDTDRPPWILTRYRYTHNLLKGLTNPGLFKPTVDISYLLSKGIGWLSWRQLKSILETTREEFRTQVERKFVEDLIVYLDYKIREGERIRTERKQMSFW